MSESPKTSAPIDDLISNIGSHDISVRIHALHGLRKLTRLSEENRNLVANNQTVIPSLLELLSSTSSGEDDLKTKELAMAVLLNLSLNDNLKETIASLEAIQCISNLVLSTIEFRESGASILCSLAAVDKNKGKMGVGGSIEALVTILQADPQFNDVVVALSALIELLIYNGNKALAVRAGAVPTLFLFLEKDEFAEPSVAILALVARHIEGKEAIAKIDGWVGGIVTCIKRRCMQSKENATLLLSEMFEYDYEKVKEADQEYDVCCLLTRLCIHGSSKVREIARLLVKRMMEVETIGYVTADEEAFESDASLKNVTPISLETPMTVEDASVIDETHIVLETQLVAETPMIVETPIEVDA